MGLMLIGQYDSPFVRRVGIALDLYGMPFDHRPWSTFGDVERIRPYNPLVRVPTLVLEDGEVLIESHLILDHLDSRVAPDDALFPRAEPARRRALKVAALAMGVCDKVVSLFYEKRLHDAVSEAWTGRCSAQIRDAMAELERIRAAAPGDWLDGRLGHADIAVAVAVRFLGEVHPGLVDMAAHPALAAHGAQAEALPVFGRIRQEFIPPA